VGHTKGRRDRGRRKNRGDLRNMTQDKTDNALKWQDIEEIIALAYKDAEKWFIAWAVTAMALLVSNLLWIIRGGEEKWQVLSL